MESRAYRQEYYAEQAGVPGVPLFGYNRERRAKEPLAFHTHPGCAELVFLLGGTECYAAEGRTFTLSRGAAFYSAPGQIHGSGGGYTPVSEFYWLQLRVPDTEGFLNLDREAGQAIQEKISSFPGHILTVDTRTLELLRECHAALREGENALYLAGLFTCLVSWLFLRTGAAEKEDGTIREALRYLDGHLSEPLTLAMLAKRFCMSESAFQHKIREQTGYSFRDYRNRQRIVRARRLLLEGRSVTETAMELGFNSADYFSSVFRKYHAVTPTQWLKEDRSGDTRELLLGDIRGEGGLGDGREGF